MDEPSLKIYQNGDNAQRAGRGRDQLANKRMIEFTPN